MKHWFAQMSPGWGLKQADPACCEVRWRQRQWLRLGTGELMKDGHFCFAASRRSQETAVC